MIDKDLVMRLYRRGKTYEEIADEIRYSTKQVGRTVRENKVYLDEMLHKESRSGKEDSTWYILASMGLTLNDIGFYVGVSSQYVQQKIQKFLK